MNDSLIKGVAFLVVGIFGLFGGRGGGKDDCPNCHRPAPTIEQSQRPQKHLQMPAGPQSTQREVDACFREVNRYRAEHGKPPLTIDPILTKIARQRAGGTPHYIRGQGWVWDAARRAGFCKSADIRLCTDNWASGPLSGREAAVAWEESTVGHDQQLLGYCNFNHRWVNAGYNCCGIAKSGQNWIIVLGRK